MTSPDPECTSVELEKSQEKYQVWPNGDMPGPGPNIAGKVTGAACLQPALCRISSTKRKIIVLF
jgi:hypothetical protein